MARVAQKRLAGRHGFEDTALPFDAQVGAVADLPGHEPNDGFRAMSIEVVHHEMPDCGRRTLPDQSLEVAGEVFLGTGRLDVGNDLAGGGLKSADQGLRVMANVLELPTFDVTCTHRSGASPLLAKPEMGSVRFRVHKIRRRPWPSAARVHPASVPVRTPRGTGTPTMTGRRVAWLGLSSPPALTRRTPTKGSALRLRGGRRTPLVAYAPSLSCAPPWSGEELDPTAQLPVRAG